MFNTWYKTNKKMLSPASCRRGCCIHNIMVSVLFSFRFTVLVNCYSVHLYISFFHLIISTVSFVSLCICSNYMLTSMNICILRIHPMLMYTMLVYWRIWMIWHNTLSLFDLHYTCLFIKSIILYLLISKKVIGRIMSN